MEAFSADSMRVDAVEGEAGVKRLRQHAIGTARALDHMRQHWSADVRCVAVVWRLARFGKRVWRELALQPLMLHRSGKSPHFLESFMLHPPTRRTQAWQATVKAWALKSPSARFLLVGDSDAKRHRDWHVDVVQAPDMDYARVAVPRVSTVGGWHASSVTPFAWVVEHDLIPRGGQPVRGGTRGAATYFNAWIDASVRVVWEAAMPHLPPVPHLTSPVPLYHGTSTALGWLTSPDAVRPSSKGMLGAGVYGGSVWKAARYAGWDRTVSQDTEFTPRPRHGGAILRLLLFAPASRIARLSAPQEDGCWRMTKDAAVMPPTQRTDWNAGAWWTRNEEWCCRPETILAVAWAVLDCASMPTTRRNPWWRMLTFT